MEKFNADQLQIVNHSVAMAEELVSNTYKMSASQWLRNRYDVKTLIDLSEEEMVQGPFAHLIRYVGYRDNATLSSSAYDFYKICLQDHSIVKTLKKFPHLKLFPFLLYIVTHELIHIVRFSRFLQIFEAPPTEKIAEEIRVHAKTHEILNPVRLSGLKDVLDFYDDWRVSPERGMAENNSA